MRVDVHHHVLPAGYMDALRAWGADRTSGIRFPEWHPEDSLAVMDRYGIDAAVLSLSTPGAGFAPKPEGRALARSCNEWVAQLVVGHPGRFGALACLPLPDVDGALEEIAYALDELDLDGVALLTSNPAGYLGDALFEPLFEELDRRQAVVFVHPTTPPVVPDLDLPAHAVEFVADTTRAAANLIFSGTIERHPGVTFVLAHAGGFAPYVAARLELAWEGRPEAQARAPAGALASLARFHYDTAVAATPYALPGVLALAGPDHLLLGTDFPFVPESVVPWTLDGLANTLDPPTRESVEGANALRLFPRIQSRLADHGED